MNRRRISILTSAAFLLTMQMSSIAGVGITSYLPVIMTAPSFRLTDTCRHIEALSDLRGKVVVLNFMYTHCTSQCPMVAQRLGRIASALKSANRPGREARIVSISFDTQRDTPTYLAAYAKTAGADPTIWQFLTGSSAEMERVLNQFDFYAHQEPTGDYDHVSRVYLIDQAGRLRQIYSTAFLDKDVVLRDVNSLLNESAAPAQLTRRQ